MPSLAEQIAATDQSGYVVAPAGYGKTYLIADAVSQGASRQLILTHTYAGVDALRVKLRSLRVSTRLYRVDTIASWALRLALAFRKTSGWKADHPSSKAWPKLYGVAADLVQRQFLVRMLRATYGGVYVDEYQDCSAAQHQLILAIGKTLPLRIFGDPMQAIFDFHGDGIDWTKDVANSFASFGKLETPHRWINAGATELGDWLKLVRHKLETGGAISLESGLPKNVQVKFVGDATAMAIQGANTCRYFTCGKGEGAIAIFGGAAGKNRGHNMAKRVGGRFTSIEEIEGKALVSAVKAIEDAQSSQQRLNAILAFAGNCFSNLSGALPAAMKRGEETAIKAKTRNPEVAKAANLYLADGKSSNAMRLLQLLREIDGVATVRADLLNRMICVLRKQAVNPNLSLSEAAAQYQSEFRRSGRPVRGHLIGTTLLVKGLQFDHAIVMDPSTLSKREAYVALTRGAKSLTIIASAKTLTFA